MSLTAIKLNAVRPEERVRGVADLNLIGEQMQASGTTPPLIRQHPSESENPAKEQYEGCGREDRYKSSRRKQNSGCDQNNFRDQKEPAT